jgi:ABC-type bacteriocin/lantibiotic exporter with double-glycine peptidase domain
VITDAISKIGHTKTMIIIAHRLNTLEKCDVIYEIKDMGIIRKESV